MAFKFGQEETQSLDLMNSPCRKPSRIFVAAEHYTLSFRLDCISMVLCPSWRGSNCSRWLQTYLDVNGEETSFNQTTSTWHCVVALPRFINRVVVIAEKGSNIKVQYLAAVCYICTSSLSVRVVNFYKLLGKPYLMWFPIPNPPFFKLWNISILSALNNPKIRIKNKNRTILWGMCMMS